MTTLFISDLHLDATRPHITRAFLHYLDHQTRNAHALYILGDFFEAWIGDDDDDPLAEEVCGALAAASQRLTIYFMRGNRDFLIGDGFARRSAVTLLEDPCVHEVEGQRILLMHGDSLCTDDAEYQAFRHQVRSQAWQDAVLAKPLAERRALAADLRARSRSMSALKAQDIMDVNAQAVIEQMRSHGVDQLIHGHTHRPACHPLKIGAAEGLRWVLGDWDERGWQIRVELDDVRLESFDIAK